MKVQKLFSLDFNLVEKLKLEQNASFLVNKLIEQYYLSVIPASEGLTILAIDEQELKEKEKQLKERKLNFERKLKEQKEAEQELLKQEMKELKKIEDKKKRLKSFWLDEMKTEMNDKLLDEYLKGGYTDFFRFMDKYKK